MLRDDIRCVVISTGKLRSLCRNADTHDLLRLYCRTLMIMLGLSARKTDVAKFTVYIKLPNHYRPNMALELMIHD